MLATNSAFSTEGLVHSGVASAMQFYAATGNTFSLSSSPLSGRSGEYKFAMLDNWDGCGAVALSPTVIRLAEHLVGQFSGIDHLVEVAPGRDGSISLIWDDERGHYVYLDVGPSDTVHLFYETAGARWEGVSVATDPRMANHLQQAFAQMYPPQPQQIIVHFEPTVEYFFRQFIVRSTLLASC
jgi:hypothetical protein